MGNDVLSGSGGNDFINGVYGVDTLRGGAGNDTLLGGSDDDSLSGGTDSDVLDGGSANDTLKGDDGNDTLNGNEGNDTMFGGDGTDVLSGGGGADWMDGGPGADRFRYGADGGAASSTGAQYDTIVHFKAGEDVFGTWLKITGVDQTVSHGQLSDATFDADLGASLTSAALGANHAVLFTPDTGGHAGQTFLVIDANGSAGYQAGEDLVIRLENPLNMSAFGVSDFV